MCNTKKFWEEYTQKNGNEIVNECLDNENKPEALVYFYWHPEDYADVEAIEEPYKIAFETWETALRVIVIMDPEEKNVIHDDFIPYEYIRQFYVSKTE